ncbi:MAG TPA: thiamine-binding protein [Salinivirga sp.]|uniref:thiamine-binding protein n=1 Tax=Salinivirga sp. TaxID=1970192 RepID=UPI002B489D29|nr:thiamine-binding protein [Salinivirga sp.]HKK58973.1 thiamine-binding protein [Salinivirga sp.]
MFISVEISYYPLENNYDQPVSEFIERLNQMPDINTEVGSMSTLITGEYRKVMDALDALMSHFFENYSSVFNVKISNSCPV